MMELPQVIPDHRLLLELAPEELGAKMLFLLRKRKLTEFNPANLRDELWVQRSRHAPNSPPQYPRQYQEQIDGAIDEAWGWVEHRAL